MGNTDQPKTSDEEGGVSIVDNPESQYAKEDNDPKSEIPQITPQYLREVLNIPEIQVTTDESLLDDYADKIPASRPVIVGLEGDNPVFAKIVSVTGRNNQDNLIALRQANEEVLGINLANLINPAYPKGKLALINDNLYIIQDYIVGAQDYSVEGGTHTMSRNAHVLLNMVIGSTGDGTTQAIVLGETYIPIDLTSNLEEVPDVDVYIENYLKDEGRKGTDIGKYGYRIKTNLWNRRSTRSYLEKYALELSEIADNRESIERCFDGFIGSRRKKEEQIDEVQRRLRLIPTVLEEMKKQKLI